MQTTFARDMTLEGVGLHSGASVRLRLAPAPAGTGIVFVRTDLGGAEVPARWDCVTDTRLCTVLERGPARVGTVEHLMAALAGMGVDNARVEVNGPEVPVMDGSSAPFVAAIEAAGRVALAAPRLAVKVLRPVRVAHGDARVRLDPAPAPRYACAIEFAHPAIGAQEVSMDLAPGAFAREVADCRTFGFAAEVEAMRAAGLARGGSLDNAVVLGEAAVLNPGGLRRADEFARHKLLDAVGDMALAGAPLIAAYAGHKPSHAANNALLRALFAQDDAWCWAEYPPRAAAILVRTGRAGRRA
jgi:UDP-3-O-[3-hydroxymyristoyl] N-acetylglucosamine deacetylase